MRVCDDFGGYLDMGALPSRGGESMGIWLAAQVLLILVIPCMADEYVDEEPPLCFVDDIPEDDVRPIIAEEEKPLVFPDPMQEAAQIIVDGTEDLSELNMSAINWSEFYADFAPLEVDMLKEIDA